MSGTLLARAGLGHARRHPLQIGLALFGLALGVAVVVAMDLAIESSRRAFTVANEALAGRSTHEISSASARIDADLYPKLVRAAPDVQLAPLLRGEVRIALAGTAGDGSRQAASGDGELDESRALLERIRASARIEVLGVDLLAEAPFRSTFAPTGAGDPQNAGLDAAVLLDLLAERGTAITSAATAARYGLVAGEVFPASAAGRSVELRLVAAPTLGKDGREGLGASALDDRLVVDIATAEWLTRRSGTLSSIAVRAMGEPARAQLAAIRALLPAGVELRAAGARASTAGRMTASFELNLRMLSLLALVVGMFLAYNTMSFAVVQRREQFGALRALGVTRGELFRAVLLEAACLASAAALVGLLLGIVLAGELTALVARTINDLYMRVSVQTLHLDAFALAKGPVLGIGAALFAACLPAWEAASVPPRAALQRSGLEARTRDLLPRLALWSLLPLGLAVALALMPWTGLPGGFVALFAVVVFFALASPLATRLLLGLFARLAQPFGVATRLAVRGANAALSRVVVAVVALSVAVGATVGIGLMVQSFRTTVTAWLEQTLQAELYMGAGEAQFSREVMPRLLAVDGVAELSIGSTVVVDIGELPMEVTGVGVASRSPQAFSFTDGGAQGVWSHFARGGLLIGEPLAYRRDLRRGMTLDIPTVDGVRAFEIAAVFRDYGNERGGILMSLDTFAAAFDEPDITGIGVYLEPGVSVDSVREPLQKAASGYDLLLISTAAIRRASLQVFDRTFAVTDVLRVLAMAVAFCGILSALLALELERAREFAMLRAQGLTRRELWVLVCAQTGTLGGAAALLAIPFGIAMAQMLVEVVNKRAFGWTLDLHLDPGLLLESSVLAVGAALLGGLYPAWRMARAQPAHALRVD